MKKKVDIFIALWGIVLLLFINNTLYATESTPRFYPVRDRLYTHSLNGTWKFTLIEGLNVPKEYTEWTNIAFDDSAWENITVPGNWETQGFKQPEYGKDLSEYTGLYRTAFKYNPSWNGKHVILRFDGVLFGYECYVNGNKAGEWGSGYNMSQFDITPFLQKNGKNVLCVKVSTRSHGWLFDTNDCWSLTGISRDVELFALNNLYVEDVAYESDVLPDLNAIVKVCVKVNQFQAERKNYRLNVALVDQLNNHILDFSRPVNTINQAYCFEGKLKEPHLWTAENPYLYRLETTLVDEQGAVIQRIAERIGVRKVQIEGFDLKINHRPVLLRGVCLNEIDPKSGKALTYKERRQQLEMIKAANVNFIRTAHYPFGPDFLDLCDEMGFYVCEEVPFGSRGADYLRQGMDYFQELQTRADATIGRDKNHPSVIIWSLGNENPYTPVVEKLLKYVKEKDPTRPRGLPQKVSDFMNFANHPSENVDVIMGHYLSDTRIDQAVKVTRKPIIHTEYAHSLGLAFGDFENKFNRILREDKVIGGSIWCWSDQTIMTLGDNQKNDVLKSVWADSLRFLDSYGRSKVAKGKAEVWKEAADGLVYGNGYPQEDYFMVRKVYSPIVLKDTVLTGESGKENRFELEIKNRFDFTSLHGYRMNWKLCNLRKVLAKGVNWLQAEARAKEKVTLPVTLPQKADFNDLMLYIEVLSPSGMCIYDTNLPVRVGNKDYYTEFLNLPGSESIQTDITNKNISVRTNKTQLSISKDGVLTLIHKGHTLAETPLLLRVGRPLTITLDYLAQKDKFYWNPYLLMPKVYNVDTQKGKDEVRINLNCRWYRNETDRKQYIAGMVTIIVRPNENIQLDYDIHPSKEAKGKLLECGLTLKFNPTLDVFRWIGNGPYSSTPGKTAYNKRACWSIHKDDIRFTGNRGQVDIAVLSGEQGMTGLWSSNGNIGIEKAPNGSVLISQNAIVTGYGSKFTMPENLCPIQEHKRIKGSLLLSPGMSDLLNKLFAPYPTVTPEQPFLKGYGW